MTETKFNGKLLSECSRAELDDALASAEARVGELFDPNGQRLSKEDADRLWDGMAQQVREEIARRVDLNFWLGDAARILTCNGSDMHAEKVLEVHSLIADLQLRLREKIAAVNEWRKDYNEMSERKDARIAELEAENEHWAFRNGRRIAGRALAEHLLAQHFAREQNGERYEGFESTHLEQARRALDAILTDIPPMNQGIGAAIGEVPSDPRSMEARRRDG